MCAQGNEAAEMTAAVAASVVEPHGFHGIPVQAGEQGAPIFTPPLNTLISTAVPTALVSLVSGIAALSARSLSPELRSGISPHRVSRAACSDLLHFGLFLI